MKVTGTLNQIMMEIFKAALDPTKIWVCEIKEKRNKHSLNANAYYWQLLHKYAEWSGRSDVYVHNDMLEHYGQPEIINGKQQTVVLLDGINYKELPYIHLRWTDNTMVDERFRLYREYDVMKNSREYDTKEYARLVEGLIQTIQGDDAPIETLTPDELAKLKAIV